MTMTSCLECGEPCHGPRCAEHVAPDRRASRAARGYDYKWQQLSKKARRLQPFCTDCGTRDDLTVDHSPEAWERKSRGLAIRLVDVEVVCRSCNSRRGRAKPWGGGGTKSQVSTPGEVKM